MSSSLRFARQLATKTGSRGYASNPKFAPPTLNELPQPAGDFQTAYASNQRKYNMHLLLGIGSLTGTIIFGKAAGLLEFHNDYPEHIPKSSEIEY